jgi:beta-1,4-mannosyl-glycoprotein beta-1,4-N-acetylglucosaminyltransferase
MVYKEFAIKVRIFGYKMKIYDCFTFFNELDLLEIRLEELYDTVDKFIIVEANKTHQGNPKNFFLEKNRERYAKWWNKVIYIKVEDLPSPRFNQFYRFLNRFDHPTLKSLSYSLKIGSWNGENFQRNCISRGIDSLATTGDMILVGDLDEIPSKDGVSKAKELLMKKNVESVIWKMKNYKFYYNGLVDSEWIGTKAVLFKTLKKRLRNKPQNIRTSFKEKFIEKVLKKDYLNKKVIKDGWHFSWIGDKKKIFEKIKATSHIEISLETEESVFERFYPKKFEKLTSDRFPKGLIKRINKKRYKENIKDGFIKYN